MHSAQCSARSTSTSCSRRIDYCYVLADLMFLSIVIEELVVSRWAPDAYGPHQDFAELFAASPTSAYCARRFEIYNFELN